MTSEIPPEFDKPWSMSDVIIHSNNSDEKEIHAFKSALAMFSPYFRALFFGNFKEKNDASVNVDCDFEVMVEILKHIHKIGYKYNIAPKPYASEMLVKLYKAADLYDFEFIRNMCLDHMEGYPSVDMFKAAGELELYDLRTKILMKLKKGEVYELLYRSNFTVHFTKEEVLILYQTKVGQPLPKPSAELDKNSKGVLNLEETTEDLENPRVDITKLWPTADLAIFADNAMGRILYANKAVVEMMCKQFQKYLSNKTCVDLLESPVKFFAIIDEEYAVVKEILSIIHICNMSYKEERTHHPALLHAMYCAADEEHLDIPLIRNICVEMLVDQQTIDALDVLFRVDPNPHIGRPLLKMCFAMPVPKLRDWIYREDKHLSYRKGPIEFSVTHSQKEPLIWRRFARCMIYRMEEQFNVL